VEGALRIVVLADRDWTHPQGGGTGTNLYGQVSRWIAAGHRVDIVSCSYPGASPVERLGPLTLHRVGGRSTVFPRVIWRGLRGRLPEADVVLEVINGITFLTPLWLRAPHVALVHHVHREHYVEEMGRKGRVAALLLETLPLKALYGETRFLTVSESSAAEIAEHGIPRDRIGVRHNGVELAAFQPEGERTAEPTLLYLGRLKRYKHVEQLLDVLEAAPEAVLEIAGDGEHRPAIEREVDRRGLGERVRLHGHVSEEHKRELLRRSWVHVTASSVEGWCLTVMEAAASGTPSVARAVGGLPESIQHGRTGFVAETPDQFVEHTRRLLDDRALREQMGRAARERAETFTWDRTARDTLEDLRAAAQGSEQVTPFRKRVAASDTGRAAGLAAALMANNFIALIFTVVFARLLGEDGYGSLGALLAAFTILVVPGSALQAAVAREVSGAAAQGLENPAAGIWRWIERLLVALVAAAAVGVILREPLASLVGVSQEWGAAAMVPTGVLWLVLCVERGTLQGLGRYRAVGLSIVGEAGGRLLLGVLLYAIGLGVTGGFLGLSAAILAMSLALVPSLVQAVGRWQVRRAPLGFRALLGRAWVPILAFALIAALQNIDIVYVKREASDSAASSYAAASVAAKAVIWVAIGLGLYLLPEAVRRTRVGRDARPVLWRTLALVALVAVPMVLVYTVAAEPILAAVFGDDLTDAAKALPLLALAMSLLACGYLGVQYLLALGRSAFVVMLGFAAVVELVLLTLVGAALVDVALVLVGLQLVLAPAVFALVFRSANRVARGAVA
jgi:glycosyltransferase involved in cell wall biosynthesis/O-antigen/teichoic acid export membrane protein